MSGTSVVRSEVRLQVMNHFNLQCICSKCIIITVICDYYLKKVVLSAFSESMTTTWWLLGSICDFAKKIINAL